MVNPVLIPVDGSNASDRIIGPIGPLLHQRGGDVVLLRVVPRVRADDEPSEVLDAAATHLGGVTAALEKQGFKVTQRLERGEPAQTILDVANEVRAGLVAMSTHGRTGATRLLRGSVAERVLRSSPVPVLLCNPEAAAEKALGNHFERILVPLDGSTISNAVLPLVEELARSYGSHVTLLRVRPALSAVTPTEALAAQVWNEEETKESLEPQREALAKAGVDVVIRAAYGVEASEILAAAEEADLVAMTTHGRSGVSRWWFGSVAESVLRQCPCPVIVLRSRN